VKPNIPPVGVRVRSMPSIRPFAGTAPVFPGKGLEDVRLLDYKVRVLTAAEGTAARVRY